MKNLTILKFGGTSLNSDKKIETIIKIINEKLNKNEKLVVVVSAIGRAPSSYATDTILSTINSKYQETHKQETDLLMSCGETIASVIIASKLANKGLNTIPVTALKMGIITDNNYGSATPIKYKPKYLKTLLKQNKIPIITGFQALTKDNHITTIGRGGSDTTATILADMLNASKIEIYTDVNGVYDKDPQKYKDAKFYEHLTYKNAQELSDNGAKIIHKNAIKYAKPIDGIKKIKIENEVKIEKNIVRVKIFNTGDNIKEETQNRIWNRFYKSDEARTRTDGSTGIGLSIVKAIMNNYKKDYGVLNKQNGVEFYFELDLHMGEETEKTS